MIFLTLQWDKCSGPDAIGQHKFIFTADESVNQGNFNPMQIKKGTQFLVMLIEAGTDEHREFAQETPDETRDRFWKQFHALITEIAKKTGKTDEELKDEIRSSLIKEGKIKESTKELTIEQLSSEIIRLKKLKKIQ